MRTKAIAATALMTTLACGNGNRTVAPQFPLEGTYTFAGCTDGPGPCKVASYNMVDSGKVTITASGGVHWNMHCRFTPSGQTIPISTDVSGTYVLAGGDWLVLTYEGIPTPCQPLAVIWNGQKILRWPGNVSALFEKP